jgi:hypothetical protein
MAKEEQVVRVNIKIEVEVKGKVKTIHTYIEVEKLVVIVNIETEVEVKGEVKGEVKMMYIYIEVEMTTGSPELLLPEDTEAIIVKAKEMVKAATKNTNSKSLK